MGSKKRKVHESGGVFIPRKLIRSKAFWALKGLAPQYLMEFYARRRVKYVRVHERYVTVNDGEILFTYADAKNRFEVSSGRHKRALEQLLELGFIEAEFGGGMEGDCTKFGLSKRWKQYGTPEFEEKKWPKDNRKKGNPKISNYGKGRESKHNYYS